MHLIVGLGNPGNQYQATRHNVGFLAIDELAVRHGIAMKKLKGKSILGEGHIGSKRVLLAKPQTYMNLSGEAVLQLMQFYKVPHDQLFIIYDDVDLEAGALRIRKQGSSGTHNGMRNIIYLLRYDDFPRFRIGISKPKAGQDLASFVLSKFTKDEIPLVIKSIESCADAIEHGIQYSIELAMNQYNTGKKDRSREERIEKEKEE